MENAIENTNVESLRSENLVKGCVDVGKEAIRQKIISENEYEIKKDNNQKELIESYMEQDNISEKSKEYIVQKKLDDDKDCKIESEKEKTKRFAIGGGFIFVAYILSKLISKNKNDN